MPCSGLTIGWMVDRSVLEPDEDTGMRQRARARLGGSGPLWPGRQSCFCRGIDPMPKPRRSTTRSRAPSTVVRETTPAGMSTGPYGSPYYDGKQVGQLASGVTSSPMMVLLNLGMGRYGGPLLVPGEMRADSARCSASYGSIVSELQLLKLIRAERACEESESPECPNARRPVDPARTSAVQ